MVIIIDEEEEIYLKNILKTYYRAEENKEKRNEKELNLAKIIIKKIEEYLKDKLIKKIRS